LSKFQQLRVETIAKLSGAAPHKEGNENDSRHQRVRFEFRRKMDTSDKEVLKNADWEYKSSAFITIEVDPDLIIEGLYEDDKFKGVQMKTKPLKAKRIQTAS